MQRFRKIVFWLHLLCGVTAGAVILIMSVTGMLLTYEWQVLEWVDRGYRSGPPRIGAERLPVESLAARAFAAHPNIHLSSITLQSDPEAPAAIGLGRGRNLYLNPYTGEVLGEGEPRARAFFRAVTDWHRWLGAGEENRKAAKAVTGVCNLAFLFLVISGPYLWLPKIWNRLQVRNVAWFRRGLSSKARDFNWHNVIGLWTAVPLFFVVFTAATISYPSRARSEGPRREGGGEGTVSLGGLNGLWAVAERQVPGWRSLTARIPEGAKAPVTFTTAAGPRGRPDLRSQLTLKRNGEVETWEPFASQTRGRRLRSWARWVHTGEAGGLLGQTVAGIASGGAAVLVWTGMALSWRRFILRQRARKQVPSGGEHMQENA
ncbi:MAG: hypothetical protein QOH06_5591 [Acidobacteriota bacterium]|nr:hypothetical protein [Acidobacteriota bacterium]